MNYKNLVGNHSLGSLHVMTLITRQALEFMIGKFTAVRLIVISVPRISHSSMPQHKVEIASAPVQQ